MLWPGELEGHWGLYDRTHGGNSCLVIAEYLEERINYSDESKKTVTNDNMFNYIRCGRDTAVCFSSIAYSSHLGGCTAIFAAAARKYTVPARFF